jgi:protein SHQ1
MLTPKFSATQTEHHVILEIRAPYVRSSNLETLILGNNFRFHCKPYFLSLYFSSDLQEEEGEGNDQNCKSSGPQAVARYDVDTGVFHFSLPKRVPGTFFTDLDIIATLLHPTRETCAKLCRGMACIVLLVGIHGFNLYCRIRKLDRRVRYAAL